MRAGLLFAALTICGAPAHAAKVVDRIVAVVNDEIILESEVDQAAQGMLRAPIDLSSPDGRKQWLDHRRKTLDTLVDHKLVRQQASELKLAVTMEEVERALEEVKKQNQLEDAQFVEALKQQGFTLEAYRRDLKQQMLEMKVMNTAVLSRIRVSDEEVKVAYNQRERQLETNKASHLKQILIAVATAASPAEIAKARTSAEAALAEVRGGKAFSAVAKARSDDAGTKEDGGDVGWVQRGTLQDELDEVVSSMEPGDLRGPIRADRGFYLLQVVERKAADVKPYDQVKESLRKELYDTQVQKAQGAFVKELRKRSHLDVRF